MRSSGVAYAPGSAPAYGGGASTRAVATSGSTAYAGGMDYDSADPRTCTAEKTDGTRCKAFAVNGGTVCIGHRNAAEKEARVEGDS